jgi:hypothetical protein
VQVSMTQLTVSDRQAPPEPAPYGTPGEFHSHTKVVLRPDIDARTCQRVTSTRSGAESILDLLVGLFVPRRSGPPGVSLPSRDVRATRPCCTARPVCGRTPCPHRTGRLRPHPP